MIAIVDYGMGNLNSIEKALELALLNTKLSHKIQITHNKMDILEADVVVLPGVGAFGAAMKHLKDYDLINTLKEVALVHKKAFLGICLGYQLMFDKSYEDGEFKGLGFFRGEVKKFSNPNLKIPHMGWNLAHDKYFYFVHSYYVETNEQAEIWYSDYGIKFAAGIRKDNIWGFQFHPEKSQSNGIKLLEDFLKAVV